MKIEKFNEKSGYSSCTKEDLIETGKKKAIILKFEREVIFPTLEKYMKIHPELIEKSAKDMDFSISSYSIGDGTSS